MDWLIWPLAPCESDNHLLFSIEIKRDSPCKYLNMLQRVRDWLFSEAGNVTSIATIASEYISDLFVGRMNVTLSAPFSFTGNPRSSGAFQRVEPLLFGVESLTEEMSLVVDESPKSVRRGLPLRSIRTFACVSDSARRKTEGEIGCLRSLDLRELHRWSVDTQDPLSRQAATCQGSEAGYGE